MIEFKKEIETSQFYDPSEDELKDTSVEVRHDPLTGRTSRILEKPLPMKEGADMDKMEKGFCPFCPENIETVGARDNKVLNGEMMKEGEATLLSNISPYAEYSLVIPLTKTHYLQLDEFKKEHFVNAFQLVQEYLRKLTEMKSEVYPTIIMNYLKPAGSSLTHPHIQVMVTGTPFENQGRVLSSEERFYDENGTSYWEELVKEERNGERFIYETDGFTWMTPFAPLGLEHVRGVCLEDFIDLEDDYLKGMAQGIVNVLKGYHEMGKNSFNISVLMSPLEDDRNRTVVDLVARSNFDKYYWCDVFSLEKLFGEKSSNKTPEDVAGYMKDIF
ncbi:MAG: hypothetical protein R6W73_04435 [Candidatus Saliniplasma sp.]